MMVAASPVHRQVPLSALLGGRPCAADPLISGVKLDSRAVVAGDLFLAVPGEVHDGRQFIEQAVASGAAAVVAEPPASGFVDDLPVPLVELPDLQQEAGVLAARYYQHPSRALHMVGVTGTNGKTTTTRLIARLCRQLGKSCGVIGTLGATLGDGIEEAGNTTPDPLSLQRVLDQWRGLGTFAVAMEVSSHALVQGRVNGTEFETAVFTNLSHDHLDYHGSMDAYGRAKLQLFRMPGLRHAVINRDDDFGRAAAQALPPGLRCLTYSARGDAAADLRVEGATFHPGGVRGRLVTPWGSGDFDSPLPGDFNLANLTAAVAAVVLAGEPLQRVLAAVPAIGQVPGRMQRIPNDLGLEVIVDYAHTPDALQQVLRALRGHVPGALVTVFGCGGDRDADKRPLMGRIACQLSDRVVLTSDNPRGEDPREIVRDIESGCSGDYRLELDRARAIETALLEAQPGDCVVIAGKGHEDYQLVGGRRLPFSDEQQALAALARRAPA